MIEQLELRTALAQRWTAAGLLADLPGGISSESLPKRREMPYAIARPLGGADQQKTNVGRYTSCLFEIGVAAIVQDEAERLCERLLAATENAPLTLSTGYRVVGIARGASRYEELDGFTMVWVGMTGVVASSPQRSPT